MNKEHSFFICDEDFAIDKEGLVRELAERIFNDLNCIHCFNSHKKEFPSFRSVQMHMVEKGHTMMHPDFMSEFGKFYDFTPKYIEVEQKYKHVGGDEHKAMAIGTDFDDSGECKTNNTNGGGESAVRFGKNDLKRLLRSKFRKNDLGELVLPNGKLIGARKNLRYYKQYCSNNAFQRQFFLRALETNKVVDPSTAMMAYNDLSELKRLYKMTVLKNENALKDVKKAQNRKFEKADHHFMVNTRRTKDRTLKLHNHVLTTHYKDRNLCTS